MWYSKSCPRGCCRQGACRSATGRDEDLPRHPLRHPGTQRLAIGVQRGQSAGHGPGQGCWSSSLRSGWSYCTSRSTAVKGCEYTARTCATSALRQTMNGRGPCEGYSSVRAALPNGGSIPGFWARVLSSKVDFGRQRVCRTGDGLHHDAVCLPSTALPPRAGNPTGWAKPGQMTRFTFLPRLTLAAARRLSCSCRRHWRRRFERIAPGPSRLVGSA